MDQEESGASAGVRKRKRKPRGNGGVRKRNRHSGGGEGGGEPQQPDKVAVAAAAALVAKVAECVQKEEAADYEGITEESVAEMMSWLAVDLPSPAAAGDGVVAAAGTSPPVAAAPAGAGAGYVIVQGSMAESCGPSFSGSASTVMASVDARFVAPVVPWPWREAAAGLQEEEQKVDDEWVAGLLTDGPAEEVGWTGWYCAQEQA